MAVAFNLEYIHYILERVANNLLFYALPRNQRRINSSIKRHSTYSSLLGIFSYVRIIQSYW